MFRFLDICEMSRDENFGENFQQFFDRLQTVMADRSNLRATTFTPHDVIEHVKTAKRRENYRNLELKSKNLHKNARKLPKNGLKCSKIALKRLQIAKIIKNVQKNRNLYGDKSGFKHFRVKKNTFSYFREFLATL